MWTYDADADVTAAQAARALGISRQVIAMWQRGGKIVPRRLKGRSPLYRLGDIIAVNAEMLAKPQHCHRKPARAA